MARISFIYFDVHTGYYPSFHHGLASIFRVLKMEGHEISLYHLRSEEECERTRLSLQTAPPDILGLSFSTNQKKYAQAFLGEEPTPAKLVIAGGTHCSVSGEHVFEEIPGLHGVCIGEGEIPMRDLCSHLDRNDDYTTVPGFYFKKKDRIQKNPIPALRDLDELPLPDYSLFHYERIVSDNGYCFPMMLSRGCPYNCSFCCNHIFQRMYPNPDKYVRHPSPERALQIIESNLRLCPKTRSISFADDTFTLNKAWLFDFCLRYKKEIGLPFLCNARVETIQDEVLRALKNAGCMMIHFGVETGNEWLRRNILNRKHSNQKIVRAFELTRKHAIKSMAFNMVGLPFETKSMAKDTLRLNERIRPDFGKCFYFFPYPGSRLHASCRDYGLLLDEAESRSGYLESPSIKDVFMSFNKMMKYREELQSFFYARLILSKLKIPAFAEFFLIHAVYLFRRPLMYILERPNSKSLIARFRNLTRWFAVTYLRS